MTGEMMEKWLVMMLLSSFLLNMFSYISAMLALLQKKKQKESTTK